jgi:hypothetical protein
MTGTDRIRQLHRSLSIVFTLGVIINILVMGVMEKPPAWVGLLALLPLAVLWVTGLYLFVLPYTAHGRSGKSAV